MVSSVTMKTAVLAVLALLVAGGVGVLVLGRSPVSTTGTGSGGGSGDGSDGGGAPGGGADAPPLPRGKGEVPTPVPPPPKPAPEREFWRDEPDGVPPRPADPPPEGGSVGDVTRTAAGEGELPPGVVAMEGKIQGMRLGEVRYRSRRLSAVLEDLTRRTELVFELADEKLGEEPILSEGEDRLLYEVLSEIALTRNLKFEIRADKVVFSR